MSYTKQQMRGRYDEFYKSTHWCDADPAVDLVAEPDACGPSIEAIASANRPNECRYKNAFDPTWSPNAIYFQDRRKPLDFN